MVRGILHILTIRATRAYHCNILLCKRFIIFRCSRYSAQCTTKTRCGSTRQHHNITSWNGKILCPSSSDVRWQHYVYYNSIAQTSQSNIIYKHFFFIRFASRRTHMISINIRNVLLVRKYNAVGTS